MFNIFKKKAKKPAFNHTATLASLDSIFESLAKQKHLDKAYSIAEGIRQWINIGDKQLEAKHWQILAEYASDQVKDLSKSEFPKRAFTGRICKNYHFEPKNGEGASDALARYETERRQCQHPDLCTPTSNCRSNELDKHEKDISSMKTAYVKGEGGMVYTCGGVDSYPFNPLDPEEVLTKEQIDKLLQSLKRANDTQFGQTKVVGCKGKGCCDKAERRNDPISR